jgi:hypothetical protein
MEYHPRQRARPDVDAESKPMELNSTKLGPKRFFTVAEAELWTEFREPQCAARVAEVVALDEVPKASCGTITAIVKNAIAFRYGHSTATSITKYLRLPVFAKRQKLVSKSTKAATAEATEVAAEAEAGALLEKTKRLAVEYEDMDQGALAEALAKTSDSGGLLRERWHAQSILYVPDLRAARFGGYFAGPRGGHRRDGGQCRGGRRRGR